MRDYTGSHQVELKEKQAGRGLIPCPAGRSCVPCGGATRITRATGLVRVRVLPPTSGAGALGGRRQLEARRRCKAFDLTKAGGFKQRYPRGALRLRGFYAGNHRLRNKREAVSRPKPDGVFEQLGFERVVELIGVFRE